MFVSYACVMCIHKIVKESLNLTFEDMQDIICQPNLLISWFKGWQCDSHKTNMRPKISWMLIVSPDHIILLQRCIC